MNELSEIAELRALLRSRVPLILIETHEELRILELLHQASDLEGQWLFRWSISDGLRSQQRPSLEKGAIDNTHEFRDALRFIDDSTQKGVYVLLDAHHGFEDPVNVRLIREIALEYHRVARTLVFVSPRLQNVPSELLRLAAHFHPVLPTTEDIREIIKEEARLHRTLSGEGVRSNQRVFDLLVMHLSGLERDDVRRLVRQAIRNDNALTDDDVRRVLATKHAALGGADALSFEQSRTDFDAVGGLEQMKHWVSLRQSPFLDASLAQDRPKGILLLGVMGSGKSLCARAIAGQWGIPLLRLDFGAVYNRFYGESERNLRNALKAAEGMAPCVLWVDELEKGLSSTSDTDGGVSRRILGMFLTWLSEREARSRPVFLVATANDISSLPPELVRKGRFDEIFFVDLPGESARAQIAKIHLEKRGLVAEEFNLSDVARKSVGFSGAEIEQAIVAAVFEARARQKKPEASDLALELQRTRPLSVVMSERIASLRAWARERAVMASDS